MFAQSTVVKQHKIKRKFPCLLSWILLELTKMNEKKVRLHKRMIDVFSSLASLASQAKCMVTKNMHILQFFHKQSEPFQ